MHGLKPDKEMCRDKLKELQGIKALIEEELIKAKLEWALKKDVLDYDKEGWAYELRVEELQKEVDEIDKQISRWKWYAKPPSKQKNSFDVENINHNFLIENLIGSPTRRQGKRSYYCCPLHNENTPSFVVYEDQNRWYCFGACAKGGSIIDLYMELHDVDFVTACKALST